MVKSYLKYEFSRSFGLIASSSSNVVWTAGDQTSNGTTKFQGSGRAVVGANEEVLCWDLKTGTLLNRWRDPTTESQVTAIAQSDADPDLFAVGYSDGKIRIWDSRLLTVVISFNGHKSAITALEFDRTGARLASGAQDTDIIIWDLVAEVGLFKLRGHKNQITGLRFLESQGYDDNADSELGTNGEPSVSKGPIDELTEAKFLVSVGKDALLKLWDLNSQHCIETHISQANGECWSLALSPGHDGCITGGNEGELRIWNIDVRRLYQESSALSQDATHRYIREHGAIYRHNKDRTVGVHFNSSGKYVAAHGPQKAVELFRIRSAAEVQRSLARKRRRRREKAKEAGSDGTSQPIDEVDEEIDVSKADISEYVVPHLIVRPGGKVKSIDWCATSKKALQLLVSTTNNQLEVYSIVDKSGTKRSKLDDAEEYSRMFGVDLPGHRTDIRSLALSSDDRMLASASNGALKIWNVRTQSCIRSLDCGYAMCCAFLPGDKIVAVGTKNGDVELFDIASASLIESLKAHESTIYAIHVHPNGKSLVTGSGDKSAKFWNFQIVQEEVPGSLRTTARLRLVNSRVLKVSDEILSLRFSPDSRLLAVALLDNTVKIFFADTLKLFLNLFGHKLPVLSMDISYDSKLIVTCSADKNVRIWGLDFGDCHKAFFAHQDSVMQVAFVPHNQDGNGHHFFSASKDGSIKYWDGDKFEQIQRLDGHHGEIWALAVSKSGEFLASAAHDKSIRVWEQTDEQIFLEEEREKELEDMYEKTLTTSLEQEEDVDGEKAEAVAAGKQTAETLMAGERIMEALDIGLEDLQLVRDWEMQKATQPSMAPPQRNLIFMALGNISAEEHVLVVIQKIKAAALQDALLVLPFERVVALFTFLRIWMERRWDTPLTCRVLFFMLKMHHRQIVASKTMRPMLNDIRQSLRTALQRQKDEMGFNMAALRYIGSQIKTQGSSDYIDDEVLQDETLDKARKKRAFLDVA